MLKKLKKRLIFLYTGTTSLILTVILITTFIYQQSILHQKTLTEFQNLLVDLSAKMETDNSFSDDWLAKMESSNQSVIYIEENRIPLFFRGAWVTKTDREILTERAKKMSKKENT